MEVTRVFETSLYVPDLNVAEQFYTTVLGLSRISRFADRGLALRCGDSVLLLFNAERTRVKDRDVPAHGAEGAGHVAFAVEPETLDAWRAHLERHGVDIETEVEWENGARSIYVRDPAGNSVELAPPSLWGT